MGRPLKEDKKISISFSVSERQLRALNFCKGATPSERLQWLLDDLDKRNRTLVVYDKARVIAENYTPVFIADGAFMYYLQTDTSYEFGENLPIQVHAKMKPEAMEDFLLDHGYEVTLVKFEDLNFAALWVRRNVKGDRILDLQKIVKEFTDAVEKLYST